MVQFGRVKIFHFSLLIIFCLVVVSCGSDSEKQPDQSNSLTSEVKKKSVPTPQFQADSAYAYIAKQVAFGPRVPGTDAHANCAIYLEEKLKSFGYDVMVQSGTVQTFDGKKYLLKNIIASINPTAQKRNLLCSHWDTRPWADKDFENADQPFDGANDGASGVGVAMEIARNTFNALPDVGIDIIFFDLEDYGSSDFEDSWCLGSKYWSENVHMPNYYASFGILLDMVGAPNAIFPKEGNSVDFAPQVVNKVWRVANELGYGNHFLSETRNFVGIDDHIYVNKAGVPCIDIIEYNMSNGAFGDYHHTHKDNMDVIDKNTLKAVGQTLLEVIYRE